MLQRVRDKMVKSQECRCISEIEQFPLDARMAVSAWYLEKEHVQTLQKAFFLCEKVNAFLFVNQIQSRCAIYKNHCSISSVKCVCVCPGSALPICILRNCAIN